MSRGTSGSGFLRSRTMATASGQWEDASLLGYEDEAKPSAQNHSDSDVEMASTEEEMNLDARLTPR
eukprot:scaffold3740_cov51-Cyclotella_meneghiniana.AAC.11